MIRVADIQGHWVRRWIKAPGFEDHATRVHWMQAGETYADVRIPLERPDQGAATCPADLPAAALYALAQAEGFAGHVTLDGDACTWHRSVNWHGTPEGADVGRIDFDADGRMIETGVLADYTELWEQTAKTATRAIRFASEDYAGVLVSEDGIGVLGIGRTSTPTTAPLVRELQHVAIPHGVDALFDGLHALCAIRDGQAIAMLATNPFVERQQCLSLKDDAVIWHKSDFGGTRTEVEMRLCGEMS